MRHLFRILPVLVLAGCANPFGAPREGAVRAALAGEDLVVSNRLETSIYYAAIGDDALILFAPCVRADCPRLGAGDSVRIPLDEIPAGAESETIAVHWWLAVTTNGAERKPGVVRTIRLSR